MRSRNDRSGQRCEGASDFGWKSKRRLQCELRSIWICAFAFENSESESLRMLRRSISIVRPWRNGKRIAIHHAEERIGGKLHDVRESQRKSWLLELINEFINSLGTCFAEANGEFDVSLPRDLGQHRSESRTRNGCYRWRDAWERMDMVSPSPLLRGCILSKNGKNWFLQL